MVIKVEKQLKWKSGSNASYATTSSSTWKTSSWKKEGNDGSQAMRRTLDLLETPIEPMTRAKARRLKEALNGLIKEVQVEVELKQV